MVTVRLLLLLLKRLVGLIDVSFVIIGRRQLSYSADPRTFVMVDGLFWRRRMLVLLVLLMRILLVLVLVRMRLLARVASALRPILAVACDWPRRKNQQADGGEETSEFHPMMILLLLLSIVC